MAIKALESLEQFATDVILDRPAGRRASQYQTYLETLQNNAQYQNTVLFGYSLLLILNIPKGLLCRFHRFFLVLSFAY